MPITVGEPVPTPLVILPPAFIAKAKQLNQDVGNGKQHGSNFAAPDQGDVDGLSVLLLDWPADLAYGAWLWDDTLGKRIGWIESGQPRTGGIPVGHNCHLEIVAPDGHSWSLKVSG
jgi:hypothetical protein